MEKNELDIILLAINGLRTELKGEINDLRTELKGEINGLRTELKGEMEKGFTQVNTRLDRIEKDAKATQLQVVKLTEETAELKVRVSRLEGPRA